VIEHAEDVVSFEELCRRIDDAALAGIRAGQVATERPTVTFDEPEPDSTEPVPFVRAVPAHRPTCWEDYIGQERVRERLEVAVRSALARNERAEHIFLESEPGQGKTTLATLIAWLLGRPLVVLTKPPKQDQFEEACEDAANGVLFVDEIHSWSNSMQLQLHQLAEEGTLDTEYGLLEFPNLTIIAATTERSGVLPALYDRFGVKCKLDPYSDDDMLGIAQGMVDRCWPTEYDRPTEDDLRRLVKASAGVPRDLRSLIFAGRDLAYSGRKVTANEVLRLCDTDPDGCTRSHFEMLSFLADSPKKTAGLTTLANALRVPPEIIRRNERLLLARRYVLLTGRGRVLTPAGKIRLAAGTIRDAPRLDHEEGRR
jgi:holliday junction DNA helicase RuvB